MMLVGILLSGALLIGGKFWAGERRDTILEHLDENKAAILDFARKNGRLPMMYMPDMGTAVGLESFIAGDNNYAQWFGWLPYKTIAQKGADPMGSPVQYFVNWQLTKDNNNRPCNALNNFFNGNIYRNEPNRSYYTSQTSWDHPDIPFFPPVTYRVTWFPRVAFKSDPTNFGFPVAAVLVSSGPDKAFSSANTTARSITNGYFEKSVPAGTFDDVVVYITLAEAYEVLNCE